MKIARPRPLAQAMIAAVLIAAGPTTAFAAATDAYYERSFVLAVNERCRLFQPSLAAALSASTWQARSAALRAGVAERTLGETAARARMRATATPCGSPELRTVGARVEDAFQGWSRTARMNFPGGRAGWAADRAAYARSTWKLMQGSATGASPVRFGVTGGLGRPDQLSAVVSWYGRPRPTGVRLVMRDVSVAPRAWLASDLPPAAQRRAIWAAGVTSAEASLLAEGREAGQAWVFPAAAADALATLDPREPFAIEFVFRDGSVARSTFEAGDFAAGRAFLAMGSL